MNPVRNHKLMKKMIAEGVESAAHHGQLLIKKAFCF